MKLLPEQIERLGRSLWHRDEQRNINAVLASSRRTQRETLQQVAYALGRALDSDEPGFWEVVAELDKVFPNVSWHNLMTDGPATRVYDGSFPLRLLKPGEQVRANPDFPGACEVGSDETGWRIYKKGDPLR